MRIGTGFWYEIWEIKHFIELPSIAAQMLRDTGNE